MMRTRKRLGQHLLHDPAVIRRIVAAIDPSADDAIVEIGGGLGALSVPLAERAGSLDIVELDDRFAAELGRLTTATVHRCDVLEFDFAALAAERGLLRIAGNLPYNISTPLLFRLLDARQTIRDMHLMLQKEVALRMAAAPGGKEYGRLTVMLSPWLDIETLFHVGPGAFRPPPKVWSTVVRIVVRSQPRFEIADQAAFARVTAKLFSMRRKTLGRIMRNELEPAELEQLGIDPRARPETLQPEQFSRIASRVG